MGPLIFIRWKLQKDIKRCKKCGEEKDLSFFPAGWKGNGRGKWCFPCERKRARELYCKKPKSYIRFKNYRDRSKNRGWDFSLDKDWAIKQMEKPCYWCETVSIERGFDRLDNRVGYTKENVVPCCIKCNYIKGDMPVEAMEILKPALIKIREKGLLDNYDPPRRVGYYKYRKSFDL